MKYLPPTLVAVALTVCGIAALVNEQRAEEAEKRAKAAQADATEARAQQKTAEKRQFADAGKKVSEAQKQADELNQKLVQAEADFKNHEATIAKLTKELELVTAERHKLLDNLKDAKADNAKLQKQLAADKEADKKPAKAEPPKPEALHWSLNYLDARAKAAQYGRPVFIDFSLPDEQCPMCSRVKREVFENRVMSDRIRREFVPVCLGNSTEAADFGVRRFPTIAIVKPDGSVKQFEPTPDVFAFQRQLDEAMK